MWSSVGGGMENEKDNYRDWFIMYHELTSPSSMCTIALWAAVLPARIENQKKGF